GADAVERDSRKTDDDLVISVRPRERDAVVARFASPAVDDPGDLRGHPEPEVVGARSAGEVLDVREDKAAVEIASIDTGNVPDVGAGGPDEILVSRGADQRLDAADLAAAKIDRRARCASRVIDDVGAEAAVKNTA